MRLLIALIDWQYPSAKEEVENTVWDINDQNTRLALWQWDAFRIES
jgi:hypothetical protein